MKGPLWARAWLILVAAACLLVVFGTFVYLAVSSPVIFCLFAGVWLFFVITYFAGKAIRTDDDS